MGQCPKPAWFSVRIGVLYGTTAHGGVSGDGIGPNGTVFELVPPPPRPGGAWTENLIYSFQGGADGTGPAAPVAFGKNGVLYGTTSYGGVMTGSSCFFEYGCGIVFQLTSPASAGGAWTEQVLYRFTDASEGGEPNSGLVVGTDGALFGTTFLGGVGPL
jgi:hypothetical protein